MRLEQGSDNSSSAKRDFPYLAASGALRHLSESPELSRQTLTLVLHLLELAFRDAVYGVERLKYDGIYICQSTHRGRQRFSLVYSQWLSFPPVSLRLCTLVSAPVDELNSAPHVHWNENAFAMSSKSSISSWRDACSRLVARYLAASGSTLPTIAAYDD